VANARVQFAFDLLNERVIYLSADPYSSNDIKKARCLHVKKGDLILRDRGYLSKAELERISGSGADFIYRYKHNTTYLDVVTGKPIALLTMLRRNPNLDIMVRLIDEQGPVVRLVANAVNEELANRRRQKLKKESRRKPGEECLALLSWSIFITSVTKEQMNYKAVFQLYMLRWRVEILFKAMKSNLNLDKIHAVTANQLQFIIYARIILLILITQFIYLPARLIIKKHFNKEISIVKITAYLGENPINMIAIIEELIVYDKQPGNKLKALARYCCYEKRRKRKNYHQFAHDVLLS
jgi:Transposase DDE domain